MAAPRVLIVPGLNGDAGFLLGLANRMFPGWRALGFDHRMDIADDGVDGLAERALSVLEADTDDDPSAPAYICGESFGGTVALTLAHAHPERVRGLILLSSFGWHPSTLARRASPALALWSFLGHRVSTPVYMAGRMVSAPTQLGFPFRRDLFREYVARPRAHIEAYRRKAELSLQFDARPWLGALEAPTLVVVGTWDPVVPASAGRELARAIPHASLHQLPGGHLVHLVHADRIGQLVGSTG
jgi:pimeloyl-ACP methyl ester carboxylesterase